MTTKVIILPLVFSTVHLFPDTPITNFYCFRLVSSLPLWYNLTLGDLKNLKSVLYIVSSSSICPQLTCTQMYIFSSTRYIKSIHIIKVGKQEYMFCKNKARQVWQENSFHQNTISLLHPFFSTPTAQFNSLTCLPQSELSKPPFYASFSQFTLHLTKMPICPPLKTFK